MEDDAGTAGTEYVKKHPIVYREDLKPSPAFTMIPDGNRITIKHKKAPKQSPGALI
nr:hypothetical protein P5658_25445 [Bacillus subtilis]